MNDVIQKVSDNVLRAEYNKRFSLKIGDKIQSSLDAVEHFGTMLEHRDREQFLILYLNGRNAVLESEVLFTGTLTTSAVYPREIIKRILETGAAAVIVAHNHPSGNPKPSLDDIKITKKIKTACEAIDASLHDHLILPAGGEHYSFADHGLI